MLKSRDIIAKKCSLVIYMDYNCTSCISCYQLEAASDMLISLSDHANINALWASMLIEECTRLGLTVNLIIYHYLSLFLPFLYIFFKFIFLSL